MPQSGPKSRIGRPSARERSETYALHSPGRSWIDPTKKGTFSATKSQSSTRQGSFVQIVMLAQLGGYGVGHDLAAVGFGRLVPVNRGVPTHVLVGVNGHPEIPCADPLLHDLFKLGRCPLRLIHAVQSL
jgi:hypothetical protein